MNELNCRIVNSQLNQHEQAIEKCSKLLLMFSNNQLLISLIYVGLIEENQVRNLKTINFTDVYDQLDKLCNRTPDNKNLMSTQKNLVLFLQTLERFNLKTKNYIQSENRSFNQSNKLNDEQSQHVNKSLIGINCIVTFDAILNPKPSAFKLAHQLYNIATTNNIKFSLVCCELIKCSLISLADSLDQDKDISKSIEIKFLNQFYRKLSDEKPNKENIRWASFIYYKIPLVLKSLKQILKDKNTNQSLDLEKGLEKLINFIPLLELIDHRTECDCLANLLNKLYKVELIDEQFQHSLLKRKEEKTEYFNNLNGKIDRNSIKKQFENLVMIQGHILLNKAEPTVDSILVSLDPEIAKKPENLIQVFVKVINGNSIEIVLNALAYTGKLGLFIKKLIYFNEINNASNGENSKQAALRGNLFDISFLILFYIVQEHGQEIILNFLEEEGVDLNSACNRNSDDMEIDGNNGEKIDQNSLANSFFVKFCLDYLPENLEKVNYEEKFIKNIDLNKVDFLLGQFSNDKFDYQLIKWNEVLLNSIGAFKELLQAYLNNYLTFDELTLYLQNMIKRNCSIGLIISFYAIIQMNTVSSEHKNKILSILNYITNSNNFSLFFNNQSEAYTYYKEKFTLTSNLIRNLMKEFIPRTILDQQNDTNNIDKAFQTIELFKVLRSIFSSTIKKGWVDTNSIYCFDKILCIGGATWFMDKLIKLLLYDCEIENLFEAVELIFGLSSLDMEQCCLALLNIIIPQYLVSHNDQLILIEPKLIALSKLLSSIMFSVLELNESPKDKIKSTIRRNSSYYIEDNFMNYEDRLMNEVSNMNGFMNDYSKENDIPIKFIKNKPHLDKRKELLFDSISRFLRLVSSLLNKEKISQRTSFSLIFLEQLVCTCSSSDYHQNNIETNRSFNPNLITNDITKIISTGLNNKVQIILQYLPFDTILNLVRIFPNKLNYDLLLAISNLQSSNSRKLTAKALCQLSRSIKFN